IFFGLPALGIKLSAWQAGVIAMVINLGAYSAEIIRAGIEATPKGQWEAGKTLGLTRMQIFTRIVIPPAYQRVYPAIVSQCIIVMLGSAVVSQISVEDLTFAANFVQSRSFLSFESYMLTAAIYLVLAIVMRQMFAFVKRVAFKNPSL
ncbi:MAG: amino acid ABC transporter permease, partial [Vibrio fluvialis]